MPREGSLVSRGEAAPLVWVASPPALAPASVAEERPWWHSTRRAKRCCGSSTTSYVASWRARSRPQTSMGSMLGKGTTRAWLMSSAKSHEAALVRSHSKRRYAGSTLGRGQRPRS